MSSEETQSISTINLWDTMFPKPPYSCVSRQSNQELESLENVTYQEDYTRVTCDTCDCGLESYSIEITDNYDDDEHPFEYTKTICKNDYLKLPRQPSRLHQLRESIKKYKEQESQAGINHYTMRYDWNLEEMTQKLDIPKLQARIPESHD